ncbi:MAG: hypothetical protein WB555_26700 [Candidatus Korobacteraceae bacterium]
MSVPICEYIRTGGKRCGSPALRDQRFCYYHTGQYEAMPMTTMFVEENPHPRPGDYPIAGFQVPFLDDASAIQIGYMQLIHGVSHLRLDTRRARLILLALQGAAANLKHVETALAAMPALAPAEAEAAKKPPMSVGKAGDRGKEKTA